jgi:hypothetical protein
MVNYYKILGVKDFASLTEIKTAYRKLSLKLHPDVNNNDPFFTEKFKELQEAYDNLDTSYKKSKYDIQLRQYFENVNASAQNSYYAKEEQTKSPEPEPKPKTAPKPETSSSRKQPSKIPWGVILSIIVVILLVYRILGRTSRQQDTEPSTSASVDSLYSPPSLAVPATQPPPVKETSQKPDTGVQGSTTDSQKNYSKYFKTGDSKAQVLKVQGEPVKVTSDLLGDHWQYPDGSVTFVDGRVTEYDNSRGGMKVQLINENEISNSKTSYFTIGSSKKTVLKLQGTPVNVTSDLLGDHWQYPDGSITFVDGRVTEYDNSQGGMKVQLIDESEISTSETDYFSIGSPKKTVLKLHGTPIKVTSDLLGDHWLYSGGSITFVDGRVKELDNSRKGLKVRF